MTEKKVLKVAWEGRSDRDGFGLWITEQSHRGDEFGRYGGVFAGSSVKIISRCEPDFIVSDSVFYTRGTRDIKDNNKIHIPDRDTLDRILAAVKEYNAYFSGEEIETVTYSMTDSLMKRIAELEKERDEWKSYSETYLKELATTRAERDRLLDWQKRVVAELKKFRDYIVNCRIHAVSENVVNRLIDEAAFWALEKSELDAPEEPKEDNK